MIDTMRGAAYAGPESMCGENWLGQSRLEHRSARLRPGALPTLDPTQRPSAPRRRVPGDI